MTLFTPISSQRRTKGFTLVEMLVVIGIIILLIGILLPALNIAYTHSVRTRMRGDIQTIAAALEAYRSDARSYPTLDYSDSTLMNAAYPASVLLCQALISPQWTDLNGTLHKGPGFQMVPNGQIYGPYIEPSRFKLVQDPVLQPNPVSGGQSVSRPYLFIADRYGHPILYFKAFTGAKPGGSSGTNYVDYWTPTSGATRPMYNLYDDQGSTTNPALCWTTDPGPCTSNGTQGAAAADSLIRMRLMLGDRNANGIIDGGEQAATTAPFLLWSPGPDEVYGPALTQDNIATAQGLTSGTWASQVPSLDDATNLPN